MAQTSQAEVGSRLEAFRTELTGYCYRMLGSGFEAEDAVQETLMRAWRSFGGYDERRGSLRTWLYRIATNVCVDMLRSPQRRALAMDLARPANPGSDLGEPAPERAWIQPIPDRDALDLAADPAETAARRETIRLAFVAALQHLPARQRAVLILRDVLCWQAGEVADLLETSVASVTSALQRARTTLRALEIPPGEPYRPADPAQRELLTRYCRAFESHDVAALVALLREDATMTMPPFVWWLRGRDHIRRAMLADPSCVGARLIPTAANGSPAFWQTRPGPTGTHAPFGLVLLDLHQGWITGITTYLNVDRLLPRFDATGSTRPDVGYAARR